MLELDTGWVPRYSAGIIIILLEELLLPDGSSATAQLLLRRNSVASDSHHRPWDWDPGTTTLTSKSPELPKRNNPYHRTKVAPRFFCTQAVPQPNPVDRMPIHLLATDP